MFRKNLETMIQAVEPGSIEYANLHCELFAADEVKRLMLESDRRDALAIVVEDIAANVAGIIDFELELNAGEVDEIDQTHYLAGPNYEPRMTPDEDYYRHINAMSKWHRGPEPMLDRG